MKRPPTTFKAVDPMLPCASIDKDVDANCSNHQTASVTQKIDALLQRPELWRASHHASCTQPAPAHKHTRPDTVSSGFNQLDTLLHRGGWPLGNLVECLTPLSTNAGSQSMAGNIGHGALHLFLPAMRQLVSASNPIVLVAPPHIPYLPGWHITSDDDKTNSRAASAPISSLAPLWVVSPGSTAGLVWACEQILQSNSTGVVISWLESAGERKLRAVELRKLQLAARRSHSLCIALRDIRAQQQASPAALRLALTPVTQRQHTQLQIQVLKQPGGWGGQQTTIAWHSRLQTPVMAAQRWPVYSPAQDALLHQGQQPSEGLPLLAPSTARLS